uniref:Shroom family member 1 n=1 Tax=Anas platyrhynchos platyrhynchos TaxID=8840 RepID=A0A493T3M3_ANAPP
MALSGNEIERWAHGQGGRIGELVEPAASPDSSRVSPVTSLGSTEQLLHLPGRADSAYSSFSGGSNVPEYPTPSCYGEHCSLPPEQVPYMDSEYVRGIYNLSAANADLRWLPPHKAPDPGSRGISPSAGLAGGCGSTPSPGAPSQGPPPSPPVRLDSFRVARHLENTRRRRSSGSPSEGSAQPAHVDVSWSQNRAEIPEPEAAGRKPVQHKGWWSAGSAEGGSVSKGLGLRTAENAERSPAQKPVKRSNAHVFSRPSSFIFQEYLRTDSVANVSKMFSAYNSAHAHKIPDETSSKPYPPGHANPRTVNDTQEDKQHPCSVRRPAFREADLRGVVPEPSRWKGSLLCAQCPLRAELDWDVFEDICDLEYMEHAPLTKNASGKLGSCRDGKQCYNSKGELGSGAGEPLLSPQAKTQKASVSCSSRADHTDDADHTALLRPKEDSASQLLNEVRKEKQASNSDPELSMHLEQEEAPAPYQKYQPGLQKQLSRELRDDFAGEQISRQTTPMLYYLAGGKATNILHHHKLAQCQEGSRSSPEEFPTSSQAPSVRSGEIRRESSQLQPASLHHRCADDGLNEAEDLVLGSPASSMDESFKNDYREKLKVAQKKVLRETSFKRKDLQMSLPVRLRQKPSKRPSIEHLRSFSLSGANEEAKLAPCSPPPLEPLERFNRDREIERPQRGQTGGRKRETKEEKKLCYSEPEKLDQLADKEAPWNQARGERTEPGTEAARRKTLENRGRALSSSSISRTELKQIQHTALVEYMERKISQRPGGTQHVPLHKPPLQKRPSLPKWPPSNPNGSRKMQSDEVFCQASSEEPPPDVFSPSALVLPPSVASRCGPSSATAGSVPSEPSPCPAAGGSRGSEQAPAESLPGAGAPAAALAAERPESTPPAAQDADRGASSASGAVSPPQPRESCLGIPSFHDPVGGGCQNREQDNDISGRSHQDAEELAPETSIPSPRSGSKEDAQVEKECRAGSPTGSTLTERPEQQLKARDAAVPQEKGTCCHTVLAESDQGDKNEPRGLFAKEAAVLDSPEDVLQERETNPSKRRLGSAEDQRYQELAMEIVAKDSSLVDILMPYPVRKTALDLMEGLFPADVSMLDKSHRRKADGQQAQGNDRKSNGDAPEECSEPELNAKQRSDSPICKGNQTPNPSGGDTKDLDDITCKKLELVSSLRSKLQVLWEDRELVLSEASECAARGKELEATVHDVCKPNEFERYLMFIGDLEKVVSLLLCLSSRLARVQNAMRKIDSNTDAEEKQSLNERHKLLSRQREDAKDLKENLDRRGRVVSGILAKYLTEQQLQDYRRFVQEKTSLLIEQKDLEEQIKFFEEQLENLEKSIPL